jgi:hypothetical protein
MSNSVADSLLGALEALMTILRSADVPVVVVDGIAVSLLGRPRFTRDIAALVDFDEARWPAIIEAGRPVGIAPRVDDALEFARRTRSATLTCDCLESRT